MREPGPLRGPGMGSWATIGPQLWASFVRLGWACPALPCLPPPRVPPGPGSDTGGGSSQTLSRLSPVCPQEAPGAGIQLCRLLPYTGQTERLA